MLADVFSLAAVAAVITLVVTAWAWLLLRLVRRLLKVWPYSRRVRYHGLLAELQVVEPTAEDKNNG